MTPSGGRAVLSTATAQNRAELSFALAGEAGGPTLNWFVEGLGAVMGRNGHVPKIGEGARVVFHRLSPERVRPYRRRAQATFVVGMVELQRPPESPLRELYPLLVRSLSNLLVALAPGRNGLEAHFVTLEQGTYALSAAVDAPERFFDTVYQRLTPLASSTLVLTNLFEPDLEPELWQGDAVTQSLREAGQRLDALNLLPAAFPIQEMLSPRDMEHVRRLFGIGGLSYGNLSARKDDRRFWMSASGVDKSNLQVIGQDMLLVKGYDAQRVAMLLSVPPNVRPRRVSVDAIEHWMIYTEHPKVGAIIHIHAWIAGIPSTQINYPCGTLELATTVAELVRQSPEPERAVIGLRNHGLTITGTSLEDIFARIYGRIIPQVPMT